MLLHKLFLVHSKFASQLFKFKKRQQAYHKRMCPPYDQNKRLLPTQRRCLFVFYSIVLLPTFVLTVLTLQRVVQDSGSCCLPAACEEEYWTSTSPLVRKLRADPASMIDFAALSGSDEQQQCKFKSQQLLVDMQCAAAFNYYSNCTIEHARASSPLCTTNTVRELNIGGLATVITALVFVAAQFLMREFCCQTVPCICCSRASCCRDKDTGEQGTCVVRCCLNPEPGEVRNSHQAMCKCCYIDWKLEFPPFMASLFFFLILFLILPSSAGVISASLAGQVQSPVVETEHLDFCENRTQRGKASICTGRRAVEFVCTHSSELPASEENGRKNHVARLNWRAGQEVTTMMTVVMLLVWSICLACLYEAIRIAFHSCAAPCCCCPTFDGEEDRAGENNFRA